MAVLTWFATNNLVSVHQEMGEIDPGGTNAFASPVTGWVVGTATTNFSKFNSQVEATVFDGTYPVSPIDSTNGDCFRTTNTYNGSFASANWTVAFEWAANTSASGQSVVVWLRLYRGANADGSSATELKSSSISGGTLGIGGGSTVSMGAIFNPGAFSVSNEYIFIQLACQRTVAGSMSTADCNLRVGGTNHSKVTSADFTAVAPPAPPDVVLQAFLPPPKFRL